MSNKRNRKTPNEIVIYGDYAEIILYDKNCEEVSRALIDTEDVDAVRTYKWSLNADNYVKAKKNNKTIYLHRLIMDPDDMFVDHINHNTLDNRKSNLRICTHQQNMNNRTIPKNNSSGFKGVSWNKATGKWTAYIYTNKKKNNLGCYDNIEDAIEARRQAELEYFGEYRNQEEDAI